MRKAGIILTVALSVVLLLVTLCVLITVHEWGHFIAARLCKIRVREFAIGMGPVIYTKQKKDEDGSPVGTKFTLRALPIGGFCDMGEDDASDDPHHFRNKTIWQKIFVLVSGAVMNLVIGFVVLLIANLLVVGWYQMTPVISNVEEQSPYYGQLQEGDRFYEINGHRIFNYVDFKLFSGRDMDKPYTFVVLRDGEQVTLTDITRVSLPYLDDDGNTIKDEEGNVQVSDRFGISVGTYDEITLSGALSQSCYLTVDYVRLVWVSLGDLISGQAKAQDLMGPVGMGSVLNDIIDQPETPVRVRIADVLNFCGLIAVNLAVMNLLPIPALDGGRIIFLFISAFLVLVRKRPLSEKVEGYIHGGTMILLFGLMIFVFFNDFVRLWSRISEWLGT